MTKSNYTPGSWPRQVWNNVWFSILRRLGLDKSVPNQHVPAQDIAQLRKLGINILPTGEVPVNMFRAAPMSALPSNAMMVFNGIRNLRDAAVDLSCNTGSINIAAVNTMRIQPLIDMGSIIQALSTSNDTLPAFQAFRAYLKVDSTSHFMIMPFVVVLENGETIANTDYNGGNANAAAIASLAGDRSLYFGPAVRASTYDSNGAVRYRAKLNLDLSWLANAYSVHYARAKLEEEDALVLQVGLIVIGIASATHAYTLDYVKAYGNVQREMTL